MNDLQKLFISELTESYDAEQQSFKALGELERSAGSSELKSALQERLGQTRGHINRLENIFNGMGTPAKGKTCRGIEGIVHEGQTIVADFHGHAALDAGLLAIAEKIEHYRIASYGSLCSWAKAMQDQRAANLLDLSLKEEQDAEAKLTKMATPEQAPDEARSLNDQQGAHQKTRMLMFLRQLRQMYDAEHLLVSALAELAYYADSFLLRFAFRHHRKQTENHVKRLEEIFCELGEPADRRPCDGIEGIIDDAQVSVFEFLGNSALDAALIAAAQKAEHYEISAYTSLCSFAKEFGLKRVLALLEKTLSEEKATDRILTFAAEWLRNPCARRQESSKRSAEVAQFLKLATHSE